jgi:hypothetical protein
VSDDTASKVIEVLTTHNKAMRLLVVIILMAGGCFWYYSDNHNDGRYVKRDELPVQEIHHDHDLLTGLCRDVAWLCHQAGKDHE